MQKKYPNQKPSILNEDTLMCDSDFMDENRIAKECKCANTANCIKVATLIMQGELEQALSQLKSIG